MNSVFVDTTQACYDTLMAQLDMQCVCQVTTVSPDKQTESNGQAGSGTN
jgi:hypothetical protein